MSNKEVNDEPEGEQNTRDQAPQSSIEVAELDLASQGSHGAKELPRRAALRIAEAKAFTNRSSWLFAGNMLNVCFCQLV